MRGPCQGPWPVAGGLPHPTRARAAPNGLLRGPVLVRNAVPTWAPPPQGQQQLGPRSLSGRLGGAEEAALSQQG